MNEENIKQLADDIREIKQAVLGDPGIGLNGLVGDMREMKEFRSSLIYKVAVMSGFVSACIIGGKTLLAKIFGTQ